MLNVTLYKGIKQAQKENRKINKEIQSLNEQFTEKYKYEFS